MKKTIFALAVTLILFATLSCHKDDDKATLQGKWFAQTERLQSYTGSTPTDDTTYIFTGGAYFEFLNDGTFNVKDEDGNVSSNTYTYDDGNKKLMTIEDGTSYEYDVTKLTSGELTLHEEETETADGITYKYVADLNLKR